ncbi:MAG TPA: protein kinase [Polyangiales bacterium]|nr:protein kinase [Polyangiales bacterium]
MVLNGRYRITELLGEGGMGLVYRGERLQLGRPVAIKFLHSPYAKSPKYMARFEREARAMSKLSHPYCVSVIDFGVHDEPYIVMDFVTGDTLRELMDKERLAPYRAIQITRQILAGLAHAHGQGVIHRDIKPGNIMVGEATGVGDHVRIFDFGLAKLHDPAAEGDQSMATVIGTPAYMAPEQTRAEQIDARADLYAVGVLLYELLVGDKPFVGEDAYAVIRMQREDTAAPLRKRSPELSEELEQVVGKALQKARDDRYQSAAEFVTALDATPEANQRMSSVPTDSGVPRLSTPRPKREPSGTHSVSAEQMARSTRRSILGLALVAVVGLFVYLTSRGQDEVSSAPVASAPARERPAAKAPAAVPPSVDEPQAAKPSEEPAQVVAELDAATVEQVAYVVSPDAGEEELRADELATADQALDMEIEAEAVPAPVPAVPVSVRNVADVQKLVKKGELDAAIEGIKQLRKKMPTNPTLPNLLGDIYFSRNWMSDALVKYREAMKLSDAFRRRASIHKNVIHALGSDRAYPKARVLLVRDIGDSALPALRRAAKSDENPVIRRRAHLIAEQLD